MDDKKPSDDHDFSDFDDLFAEIHDDMEADAAEADSLTPATDVESDAASASSPDAEMDDLVGTVADDLPASHDDAEVESMDSDVALDELLDQDWDDIVSGDEPPLESGDEPQLESGDEPQLESGDEPQLEIDDEQSEAPQAAVSEDDGESDGVLAPEAPEIDKTEAEETVPVMEDDELPDIDFPDDNRDETSTGSDDGAMEELESFDDFVIDDEPTIPPEFSAQAALEPQEQVDSPQPQDTANPPPVQQETAAEQWADDEPAHAGSDPSAEAEPIVPELFDSEDETEEETMKQSNMIALIAGAVALLASMGGLWLGYSAKAELAQLPIQAGAGNSVLNDAKLKEMDSNLTQVDARITKLATKIASIRAVTGGSSDPKLDALDSRTTRLEQLISDLKEQIGHLRTTIAGKRISTGSKKAHRPQPRARVKSKPKPKPKPKAVATTRRGGAWFVNLTSHSNARNARQQVRQMKKLGFSAESKQVVVKGRTYFRVRIPGFASKQKALAFKASLATQHHISDSWVSNY